MGVELSTEQIRSMLQGISILPQPQIMVDLQMEQLASDCTIHGITRLISRDVGLSGSIIKTVNSAFFGLRNKIGTVQQACQLLGIDCVVNIVNALSIRGELSDEEIVRVREGAAADGWSERRRLLLAAADDMHERGRIGEELWEKLSGELDEVRLIELCMLIGHYEMLAMTLRSLEVQPDFPSRL